MKEKLIKVMKIERETELIEMIVNNIEMNLHEEHHSKYAIA